MQTIERTSKGWKAVQLLGMVMMLFGSIGCWSLAQVDTNRAGTIGVFAIIGFFTFAFGRMGAWWYHG